MKEFLEILAIVYTLLAITLLGMLITLFPVIMSEWKYNKKWLWLSLISFPLGISLIVYLIQLCG